MSDYYSRKLSAERLRAVYEIAGPVIRRYLEEEIVYLQTRLLPGARALELGCGYGRILRALRGPFELCLGIDVAISSLALGCSSSRGFGTPARDGGTDDPLDGAPAADGLGTADRPAAAPVAFAAMDAQHLALADASFDVVACLQNGVSAFRVEPLLLLREALRVARPGGCVLLSTYAERLWQDRLEWFRLQAAHGLIGAIDEEATGNGTIVCEDGFRAGTLRPEQLIELARRAGAPARVTELEGGSVILEVSPLAAG